LPLTDLLAAVRARRLPKDGVMAALAGAIAEQVAPGLDRSSAGPLLDGTVSPVDLDGLLPVERTGPELLGDTLELLHERDARRRQGAFFTPRATAALVVERATTGWEWPDRPRVCDPSCGGGAFLLAAGRALESRGLARDVIADELLWGIDTDPLAVATTRASLAIWCASDGSSTSAPNVAVADALRAGLEAWSPVADPFDLVVGNPPFQSQLAVRTARTRAQAREMTERFGAASRTYSDSSTLFLVAVSSMVRSVGARFALVLPESFLSARDATAARRLIVQRSGLVGLWLPGDALFSASVRVCVPTFESGTVSGRVARWQGAQAAPAPAFDGSGDALGGATWAPLAADLLGVPAVDENPVRVLSSIATATAGFRDQFYGLRPFVRDRAPTDCQPVRLLTSGSIDLVNELWDRRATTFAGGSWRAPVVDIDRLRREDERLARWAERVLVPKVVVATQTRVVEVLVDETGRIWPSVPVIAVVAPSERLWAVAAVLASPPVSALGLRRHAGAALSGDAIKMSARQLLEIPLPPDETSWAEGAERLQAAAQAAQAGRADEWSEALHEFGTTMCRAFDASEEILSWWLGRLPAFR
jgi:hypothetical protein